MQLFGIASKEMDQASGISSISEAMGKKQVPGADTLEQIKQAKQTTVRLKGRQIEIALRDLGMLAVPNFIQFVPLSQRLKMFGEKGIVAEDYDGDLKTMVPDGVDRASFARNFPVTIQPGSLLKLYRVEEAVLYLNLRKGRDISRETLLNKLELDLDAETETARLKKEMEELPQPPPKGKDAKGGPKL